MLQEIKQCQGKNYDSLHGFTFVSKQKPKAHKKRKRDGHIQQMQWMKKHFYSPFVVHI